MPRSGFRETLTPPMIARPRTRTVGLAAQHPDRVKAMAAQWDAWAQRSDVFPLGSWKPVWGTPGK